MALHGAMWIEIGEIPEEAIADTVMALHGAMWIEIISPWQIQPFDYVMALHGAMWIEIPALPDASELTMSWPYMGSCGLK